VKIAYLAPEIPALSATFVYNEILQLESLGTNVVPFSVHEPSSQIQEPRVYDLGKRTLCLYSLSKAAVLMSNVSFLIKHPIRYIKTLGLLCTDMWEVGLFSRTAFGLGYRFIFSASLAEYLVEKKCDHIHVHFAHIPTDIAMYASSLSCVSYSVTAHANDLYERGWLLDKKVQRSQFFATISEFNKRYLADKGINVEKVEIIRCGVDPAQFTERKELVNNKIPKLGVIGRLVGKKGFDTLIKVVAILKNQGQVVELHIAGDGPLESELKSLSKDVGLTEMDISFLGSIPHSDVAEFIKSLDMFVLPCKRDENGDVDGIPVVLMEAMLSGIPVISSKLSGIPELVINKETGLLIEQNNTEELARTISSLINDDVMKNKLIGKAATKVREDFSLIENTRKLNALFHKSRGEPQNLQKLER
jgi:colanic acid/amylovoran biosynthesis glycosyltransferase